MFFSLILCLNNVYNQFKQKQGRICVKMSKKSQIDANSFFFWN